MADYVRTLVVVTCCLAVAYKIREQMRGQWSPAGIALVASFITPALTFSLQITVVAAAVERLTGWAAFAQHLSHVADLGTAFFLQAIVAFVTGPDSDAAGRVRRHARLLLVAATALTVAYALADPAHPPAPGDPAVSGFGLLYTLIFISYFGLSFARMARLVWRYARWTDHDLSRLGMQLVAAGACGAVGYCTAELIFAVVRVFGDTDPEAVETAVLVPCMLGGATLAAVGMTLPAWGHRVPALGPPLRWLASYRSLRVLYPLWADLYVVAPDIALRPPRARRAELITVTNVHRRLHRRVIEIEDGLLRLRPHRDSAVAEHAQTAAAAELQGRPLRAVVEAAVIAAALGSYATGRTFPSEPTQPGTGPNTADPADEIAWLCLVALAYRHHRFVHTGTAPLRAHPRTKRAPDSATEPSYRTLQRARAQHPEDRSRV